MKLNITFEHEIPEDLADELGINEDSAFEAYYVDGTLYVHLLTEDEEKKQGLLCPLTSTLCEENCETCAILDAVCDGDCRNCCFQGNCSERGTLK